MVATIPHLPVIDGEKVVERAGVQHLDLSIDICQVGAHTRGATPLQLIVGVALKWCVAIQRMIAEKPDGLTMHGGAQQKPQYPFCTHQQK